MIIFNIIAIALIGQVDSPMIENKIIRYYKCSSNDEQMCSSIGRVLAGYGYENAKIPVSAHGVKNAAIVKFHLFAKTSASIRGRLSWLRECGKSGESPIMSFNVSDAKLTESMLNRYTEALLRESGFLDDPQTCQQKD